MGEPRHHTLEAAVAAAIEENHNGVERTNRWARRGLMVIR
jgi:hypothetical protein